MVRRLVPATAAAGGVIISPGDPPRCGLELCRYGLARRGRSTKARLAAHTATTV